MNIIDNNLDCHLKVFLEDTHFFEGFNLISIKLAIYSCLLLRDLCMYLIMLTTVYRVEQGG